MTTTTPTAAPLLWDRLQTASQLGISPRTLDQLVADDAIPSAKIAGRRLFSPVALERWVLDQVYQAPETE